MSTRGNLGGLSRSTADVVRVLDAAGCDVVLVETVGVGQDEVEIAKWRTRRVVVLVPGAGDDVQAIKAGIIEIADIFVVNKADREGADRTVAAVEAMLSLQSPDTSEWRPPVLRTEATTGEGARRAGRRDGAVPRRGACRDWPWCHDCSAFRLRELLSSAFMRRVQAVVPAAELEALANRITD